MSRAFRAWGVEVEVTRPLHDGDVLELRDRTLQVFHRPGHSPTDTHLLGRRAQRAHRGRPPHQAHLLKPADHAHAGRRRGAHAGARDLPGFAARDARAAGRARAARATATRSTTTCALIDERFRLHERRAEKIARADRRAAAHRARDRAGAVGEHRRHPGLPHALGGARATSTCCSTAAWCTRSIATACRSSRP